MKKLNELAEVLKGFEEGKARFYWLMVIQRVNGLSNAECGYIISQL